MFGSEMQVLRFQDKEQDSSIWRDVSKVRVTETGWGAKGEVSIYENALKQILWRKKTDSTK